jgi:hypothetical protein
MLVVVIIIVWVLELTIDTHQLSTRKCAHIIDKGRKYQKIDESRKFCIICSMIILGQLILHNFWYGHP